MADNSERSQTQLASNPRTEMRERMLADEERSEQAFEELSLRIALEAHEDRLKLWEDVERLTRERDEAIKAGRTYLELLNIRSNDRDRLGATLEEVKRLLPGTLDRLPELRERIDRALSGANYAPETKHEHGAAHGTEQAVEVASKAGSSAEWSAPAAVKAVESDGPAIQSDSQASFLRGRPAAWMGKNGELMTVDDKSRHAGTARSHYFSTPLYAGSPEKAEGAP